MTLQTPDPKKLTRSAIISTSGVVIAFLFLLGLKYLFPEYDASELQTMLFTAAGAFIFNTLRESVK